MISLKRDARVLRLFRGSLILFGAIHVDRGEAGRIRTLVRQESPDLVLLELDAHRYQLLSNRQGRLSDPARGEDTPEFRVLECNSSNPALLLQSYQDRLARFFGAEPGGEMVSAIQVALDRDIALDFIDIPLQDTLQQVQGLASFRDVQSRLLEQPELDLEALPPLETFTPSTTREMLAQFARDFPALYEILITRRNEHMVSRIRYYLREGLHEKILAVVGLAHLAGISTLLEGD